MPSILSEISRKIVRNRPRRYTGADGASGLVGQVKSATTVAAVQAIVW